MRHRNTGRKFSRKSQHRRALFVNLAKALIEHERITTTDAKAKDLRRVVERLVTMAKKGVVAAGVASKAQDQAKQSGGNVAAYAGSASAIQARRAVFALLRDKLAVERLFGPLAERYRDRAGGYTRIVRAGTRPGDCAPLSIIEFVDSTRPKAEISDS